MKGQLRANYYESIFLPYTVKRTIGTFTKPYLLYLDFHQDLVSKEENFTNSSKIHGLLYRFLKKNKFKIVENHNIRKEFYQTHYDSDFVFPFLRLEMHHKKILKVKSLSQFNEFYTFFFLNKN
jgi:hypothetical protein